MSENEKQDPPPTYKAATPIKRASTGGSAPRPRPLLAAVGGYLAGLGILAGSLWLVSTLVQYLRS